MQLGGLLRWAHFYNYIFTLIGDNTRLASSSQAFIFNNCLQWHFFQKWVLSHVGFSVMFCQITVWAILSWTTHLGCGE